jgi:hypothetical protein
MPSVKAALVATPLDIASVAWALAQGAGAGPTGEQDLQLTSGTLNLGFAFHSSTQTRIQAFTRSLAHLHLELAIQRDCDRL